MHLQGYAAAIVNFNMLQSVRLKRTLSQLHQLLLQVRRKKRDVKRTEETLLEFLQNGSIGRSETDGCKIQKVCHVQNSLLCMAADIHLHTIQSVFLQLLQPGKMIAVFQTLRTAPPALEAIACCTFPAVQQAEESAKQPKKGTQQAEGAA